MARLHDQTGGQPCAIGEMAVMRESPLRSGHVLRPSHPRGPPLKPTPASMKIWLMVPGTHPCGQPGAHQYAIKFPHAPWRHRKKFPPPKININSKLLFKGRMSIEIMT